MTDGPIDGESVDADLGPEESPNEGEDVRRFADSTLDYLDVIDGPEE